ncbi:MAG: hypothetical protein NC131_05915 [Roseburia sp.]|nr:hypothetical protein [Roseburia sp.]
MELKVKEFEEFSAEKEYLNGLNLWVELGGGFEAYGVICQGKCRLGYEMARKIFNTYGQAIAYQLIDFENDTIEGFKSKYLLVGKNLASVTDMDKKDDEYLTSGESDLIYLLMYGKPKRKIFPNWYFSWQHYSIRKWKFMSWKKKNGKSWGEITEELGISRNALSKRLNSFGGWTMIDMICLCDLMGTRELFNVIYFKTKAQRLKMQALIFGGNTNE